MKFFGNSKPIQSHRELCDLIELPTRWYDSRRTAALYVTYLHNLYKRDERFANRNPRISKRKCWRDGLSFWQLAVTVDKPVA